MEFFKICAALASGEETSVYGTVNLFSGPLDITVTGKICGITRKTWATGESYFVASIYLPYSPGADFRTDILGCTDVIVRF